MEFDEQSFREQAANPNAGAERVYASFGLHPKKNPTKSLEAGRPMYDDTVYIQLVVPGDKNNVVHRPASEADKRNYPRQWAAFEANQDQDAASGTPLSQMPWVSRSLVEELAHFKCRTVEHLANMSDGAAQSFPGIQALKQKAKDYLAVAAGQAPVAQLRADVEAKEARIAQLEAALQELAQRVDAQGKGKK